MKKYLCTIFITVLALLPIINVGIFNCGEIHSNTVASIDVAWQGANRYATAYDPSRQWAISAIMANQAWEITHGQKDILIAVLDTGIDERHEDLIGQVVDRINLTSSPSSDDIYGHGTHIAGIIAALDNNLGITGIAPSVGLLNVKVADNGGWCNTESIASGIRWAVDHGAKVINISLYILKSSAEVEEAVNYAWNKGAIVISASGNGLGNRIVYPGYYANSLAVAGTNSNDSIAAWSGKSAWVHVAAPGTDIYSTIPDNRYEFKSGTSMATAYVSGLAGLLFSIIPESERTAYDNEKIRWAIENSSDLTNIDTIGRINAYKAIKTLIKLKTDRSKEFTSPVIDQPSNL